MGRFMIIRIFSGILCFYGVLSKKEEYIGENDTKYLTFAIPNREVRYIFYNKVQAWLNDQIKQRDMSCLHNAFVEKDVVTVEEELNDIDGNNQLHG